MASWRRLRKAGVPFGWFVDKPAAAKKVFAERSWETTEDDIVQVILADKPGALGSAASKLAAAGINIQYAYTGSAKGGQKVRLP